jgi:inosine-uridine nucleoside N-ribohydrolase
LEGSHVHDAVALAAVTDPGLFETTRLGADVETQGELTMGATVFDRRQAPAWRPNMDVATSIDAAAVSAAIARGWARAGQAS